MKLGARILKTGIAIVLSLFLANIVNSPAPVFAGIAAIFAVQPTIYRSYLSIIEQIQGNLVGALLAMFFVMALGNNIIIIGLAAIIVIAINLKLKIENTIALSLVTLIAIMESPGDDFIQFALIRFTTVMLGVFSAFVVNLVFLPPKYENKLYYKISNSVEEITKWIRMSIRHSSEHHLLKHDIENLKTSLIKIDQLYIMYQEERNYFRKNDLVKSRKLVVFRQMISTTKRALETLKKFHRFENELQNMPEQFQQLIQEQLDFLVHHHEEMMLRFIGKIRQPSPDDENTECLNKKDLFGLFLAQKNDLENHDESILYHTMQIVSTILDYGEQVEHLETLITSFQSYHQDENEVRIEEIKEE